MGENFKRKQAARFRHLEDQAYQPLAIPNLLTALRPEIFVTEYACIPVPGIQPVGFGTVVVLCEGREGRIDVTAGNATIAFVDPKSAGVLRAALGDACGLLRAIVSRVSAIGGFIHIRIAETGDDEKH